MTAPAPEPEASPERTKQGKRGKGGGKGGKRNSDPPTEGDPQAPIPASGVPDPLKGLGAAQICKSDSLLMVKYSFEALQGGTCGEVCCAADPSHWCCDLDWPFSDVPSCDAYAHMRNELFSRYGYPFETQEWKDAFEKAPYYRRREDFQTSWMSDVARKNIETLKRREEKKEGCMD